MRTSYRISIVWGMACLAMAAVAVAQPAPDTLWTRTYGGSSEDWAHSVQQTTDGGYIVAGTTISFGAGSRDFYLVKTNGQGDTLWTRTYGGNGSDWAWSAQQTADEGYIVTGETYSFGEGGRDFYLVKTDSLGDMRWMRSYGGRDFDCAYSVQQTADGGYIVAGRTFPLGYVGDIYIVKTDSLGDTLWTRTYGGSSDDEEAFSVQQTADGGYIMAGGSYSFSVGADFYLMKTNSLGDTLWTRTYGGSSDDYAYSVQQTTDGGYIVAGYTDSFGAGNRDFYLVKTNSLGDTLWTRTYGGSNYDYGRSVQQTADGGYIMAGETDSFGEGGLDFYLVKTNSSGDTLWTRTYGGSGVEYGYSVQQTADGGYIVAGSTYSFGAGYADFYLVKTIRDGIHIVIPNGGESWHILQNDTVSWLARGFEGNVRIELNRDYPEGEWEILIENTENDGKEAAYVTDPLSDHCRVKVSSVADTFSDISDEDFSIVCSQGYLALVRPSQPTVPVISWNAGTVECGLNFTESLRLKNFGSESTVVFQPLEPPTIEFSRTTTCPSYFALSPGQMSTCEITLTFDPSANGFYRDTLLVQSDAVNQQGGYVRFPLSGEQISIPDSPQVAITIDGNDAHLFWNRVTQSIGGCPIAVTHYLVFYSPTFAGPYYYHGYTADTTYVHLGVVRYASGQFYDVMATTAPLPLLQALPSGEAMLTREEVLGVLGR